MNLLRPFAWLRNRLCAWWSGARRGKFSGDYLLRPLGGKNWRYLPEVDHPLTFTRHDGWTISLTEEFTTDLASTPREIWWIYGFANTDMLPAAIVHDWLYVSHENGVDILDFADSNRLLEEMMLSQEPPQVTYSPVEAYLVRAACDQWGREIWDGTE